MPATPGHPLAEMGGEGAEVVTQAIAGEDGQAAGGKPVAQVVDQGVGGRLRACPEMEDGG